MLLGSNVMKKVLTGTNTRTLAKAVNAQLRLFSSSQKKSKKEKDAAEAYPLYFNYHDQMMNFSEDSNVSWYSNISLYIYILLHVAQSTWSNFFKS